MSLVIIVMLYIHFERDQNGADLDRKGAARLDHELRTSNCWIKCMLCWDIVMLHCYVCVCVNKKKRKGFGFTSNNKDQIVRWRPPEDPETERKEKG